jgi:hypothetical protein
MQHLPTDRLAALADEAPSPEESAHLALCAECSREVRAYESLLAMARAEGDTAGHLEMPLTRWDAIATELRRGTRDAVMPATRARRFAVPMWAGRAAAAVFLLAGGIAIGRVSAAGSAAVSVAKNDPPVVKPAPKPSGPKAPAPTPVELAPRASDVRVASNTAPSVDSLIPTTFASVEEARLWMQRFEMGFQNAAAFVAARDTTGVAPADPQTYRARLAALDRAGRVMRDALRDAPEDPVINGYYLTTLGQREATLRQINYAQPGGQRVIGF